MGVAMSITAFPVLARIVEDQGLLGTSVGTTAMACAAVDDVTAWILLAGVVALVTSGGAGVILLQTLAATATFVLVLIFIVRPLLARALRQNRSGAVEMLLVLSVVAASSAATAWAGLHALFGAFMAGAIMPREETEAPPRLPGRLLALSGALLLPVFFVSTGLRTEVGRLRDPEAALACLAIILVATLGKLGGAFLAARFTGMSTRDSVVLGILMNTRGLVELVVLDVGYRLGLLGPGIFTMMVLMALVTTTLAGPVVRHLRFTRESELESAGAATSPSTT
jgi:Kef-type K+ transport system membrane component KefB